MSTFRARSSRCLSGRAPRGRRSAQRGQALVEFTFFFTFVMGPMVLGVTDISALLDAHVNLVYAARQGARTGAVLGQAKPTGVVNPVDPDCAIVGAIDAALLNQPSVTLTQITIFQIPYGAPTPTWPLPSGSLEDVYSGGAVCNASGIFSPLPSVATWPANVRIVTPFHEDSIGIRLDFTYTWQFNLLGFGPFNGYDVVQYPLNPNGVPTPLP